jgi:aspartate kinase
MIINKFGGASVKDAASVKRMADICQKFITNGVIVVSAMGKTTNLLEKVVQNYIDGNEFAQPLNQFKTYHLEIIDQLFPSRHHVYEQFGDFYNQLATKLTHKHSLNYDFEYDQIVSFGELVSTIIVANYLNLVGIPAIWRDIRNSLKTDSTFREGKVDWQLSTELIANEFSDFDHKLYLTQGFIGADVNNLTTTLGREGSDYTAAIFAHTSECRKSGGLERFFRASSAPTRIGFKSSKNRSVKIIAKPLN